MSNRLEVDIHKLKNFSTQEKHKFMLAMEEMEVVINSERFKQAILDHEFDDQTNGKTNLELYEHFMSGKTKFNEVADQDIDISLTLYYSWKSVIGYTYPSTWFTWINRKFFSRFNDAEIAGNVIHEDRHNAGYGHRSARDHDSVPYAFGYIVRDLMLGKIPPRSYTNRPRRTTPTRRRRSRWSRIKGFFRRLF